MCQVYLLNLVSKTDSKEVKSCLHVVSVNCIQLRLFFNYDINECTFAWPW